MITRVKFNKFTAFDKLEIKCSPGINVFVGENGTGKTHVLKTIYAACDITKSKKSFAEKMNKVFLPSNEQIGRLVKRSARSVTGYAEVHRWLSDIEPEIKIRLSMSNHTKEPEKATISGHPKLWQETNLDSVYIPVKEMLSNAPGFRSLYNTREIHFEEVYFDIIDRAFLPVLKGPTDKQRRNLLEILKAAMDGKVTWKNEEFFLRDKQGELEFTLLAEGIRKLGLLWILIQNGTLQNGSVLCWDEPETNLNPKLMRKVVEILFELQRMGVQIFISTHNYVVLKEFDLQMNKDDKIEFHSLYRDENTKELAVKSTRDYLQIHPNAISDTFSDLYDREIDRSMKGVCK